MRQQDLALEAAKKTPKIVEPPANRDVVEPWGHVNPSQLVPGEKSMITLDVAHNMLKDVKKQISKLQQALAQTQDLEQQQEAIQAQGLLDTLNTLKDNLTAKIEKLTQEITILPPNLLKLFQRIEQDCSKFLQAAKHTNTWLYRGTQGRIKSGLDAYVGKSWNERKSKDSSSDAQTVFDIALAQLGFVALRSNSIFTTANIYRAMGFGDVFLIFPIYNQSNFTYTKEHDLTIYHIQIPVDKKKVDAWKMPILEILQNKLAELVKTNKPTDSIQFWIDIFQKNSPEQILDFVRKNKSKLKGNVPDNLLKIKYQDFIDVKKFRTKYKPNNADLAAALTDGVEIYIHGNYYALNANHYKQYAKTYFGITS